LHKMARIQKKGCGFLTLSQIMNQLVTDSSTLTLDSRECYLLVKAMTRLFSDNRGIVLRGEYNQTFRDTLMRSRQMQST
jgi:hypothetical protein